MYPRATLSPLASYVVETLITLLGVIALAVLVLYGARRLGVGRPAGPLNLVGRLPLDGRRAIYLVRVDKTIFVVGASEAGLTKLGELDGEAIALAPDPVAAQVPFVDVLARVVAKARNSTPPGERPKPEERT